MIITDLSKLREKCILVNDNEVNDIISLLDAELSEINKFGIKGIGLAAPQIGINKMAAIVRINDFKINLINCSISEKFDLHQSKEGCLSVPDKTCIVDRYNEIIIRDNNFGNINNFVSFGMVSVCIQHEIDHWSGTLMIDKAIPEHLNIGDNMECPCGSKLKYKKCCKRKK